MHQDELCHFGVKGMKWGVRKDKLIGAAKRIGKAAYAAGKEFARVAGPMIKAGAKAAREVISKLKDQVISNVKSKVQNGRQATQSPNFDELFKQEMSKVRRYQQTIETAARKGATAEEQAILGRARDDALRRAKEYKRQRGS